jgi:hypothetical protein
MWITKGDKGRTRLQARLNQNESTCHIYNKALITLEIWTMLTPYNYIETIIRKRPGI